MSRSFSLILTAICVTVLCACTPNSEDAARAYKKDGFEVLLPDEWTVANDVQLSNSRLIAVVSEDGSSFFHAEVFEVGLVRSAVPSLENFLTHFITTSTPEKDWPKGGVESFQKIERGPYSGISVEINISDIGQQNVYVEAVKWTSSSYTVFFLFQANVDAREGILGMIEPILASVKVKNI